MKSYNKTLRVILSSLFFALAYVLPFLTGQIPVFGAMLCPMHIPVLLCGFICGWQWGLCVGIVVPLLRSLTLGVPAFFPMAVCMSLELATYGAVAGLMHKILPHKKPFVYCSLLISMIVGRLVWGGAMFVCLGAVGGQFTLVAFLTSAVINAIPGIIAQIVLIPVLVMIFDNPKILKLDE